MILKQVDDKSQLLKKLRELAKHPKLYPSKRKELIYQIYNIEKGWKNEKDTAYYLNTYLKDKKQTIVIHDLRLKKDDISVNIDHLIIHRVKTFILESKFYSGGLYYNSKRGNFFIKTKNGYKDIENPLKQAERQSIRFKEFLKKTDLYTKIPTNIEYYVLVAPSVYLPKDIPKEVVKADQFIDEFWKNIDNTSTLTSLANWFLHSREKILQACDKLIHYHKPIDVEFILNRLNLSWLIKTKL